MADAAAVFEQVVTQYHRSLNGHRRPDVWPDVPKAQVNLAVCETPASHAFVLLETLKPTGRKYQLDVVVCQHCPLGFVLPVVDTKARWYS